MGIQFKYLTKGEGHFPQDINTPKLAEYEEYSLRAILSAGAEMLHEVPEATLTPAIFIPISTDGWKPGDKPRMHVSVMGKPKDLASDLGELFLVKDVMYGIGFAASCIRIDKTKFADAEKIPAPKSIEEEQALLESGKADKVVQLMYLRRMDDSYMISIDCTHEDLRSAAIADIQLDIAYMPTEGKLGGNLADLLFRIHKIL